MRKLVLKAVLLIALAAVLQMALPGASFAWKYGGHLALVYEESGDLARAVQHYEAFLGCVGADNAAVAAARRLGRMSDWLAGAAVVPGSNRQLTFGGSAGLTLAPGEGAPAAWS